MKTALEILASQWNKKYGTQPYEKHHLHYNYEDLVLLAMEEYKNQIPESVADFQKEVNSFTQYPKEMLVLFHTYWSEPNTKGKMRFQLEKTWRTSNRLALWASRNKIESKPIEKPVNLFKLSWGELLEECRKLILAGQPLPKMINERIFAVIEPDKSKRTMTLSRDIPDIVKNYLNKP